MSGQADVKSVDTLAFVKAAISSFVHEANQSLSEVEMEGRRAVDYITMDCAAHWKGEVRRAGDAVNKAIKDLEHCRAFKKVGDNQPSCIEEKKNLEKARRRLEFAEQKEAAVRRWSPVVQQQFRETCVRMVHFREVVDVDCPKAMAILERMLKALDSYREMAGPRSASGDGGSATTASITRSTDEQPPASAAPLPSALPATKGAERDTMPTPETPS
ncbi:MAG: hypothetical protein DWH79_04100 [Planctomycetota bacterium]|nr:MAG: hypothetical protein DWH79_04100 [Planctomycetota bacterium]